VSEVETKPAEPLEAEAHYAGADTPKGLRVHFAEALDALQSLSGTVVIALFVITFIIQAFQIPSESMENTLLIGDYLLVDKIGYSPSGNWPEILPYSAIKRGDIVVFKWPVHPEQHFVKRVIGIPGDRVHIANGRVFINGEEMKEDYVVHKIAQQHREDFPSRQANSYVTASWYSELAKLTRNGDLLVPEENYFVLGDNRDQSLDSRYWGLVPRENIVGKPLLIYFSMRQQSEMGAVPNDKILRLAYVVWNLPASARWGRTFRFVH
jgi:signal peptidase I